MRIKIDFNNVRVREVPVLDENNQPMDEVKQIAQVSFYFPEVTGWPVMAAILDWPATNEQIETEVLRVAQMHKTSAEQTLLLSSNLKSFDIPELT